MTPDRDTIIIQPDPIDDAQVADIKSEYLVGLKSESVAGFELECMADFIGIRTWSAKFAVCCSTAVSRSPNPLAAPGA